LREVHRRFHSHVDAEENAEPQPLKRPRAAKEIDESEVSSLF
jgi:hypothetical protein